MLEKRLLFMLEKNLDSFRMAVGIIKNNFIQQILYVKQYKNNHTLQFFS